MRVKQQIRGLRMKPIRVLHVFGALNANGAESRVMDIYRHIDRTKVQFDFLIHTEQKGSLENEIIRLGGRIYRIPRFGLKTVFAYNKSVKAFFNSHHEFKIVHGHILSTAFIYQNAAKKIGVPVRIAHSRCASRTEINAQNIIKELCERLARFYVTDEFAVSREAGMSAFGNHNVVSGKTKILPNAINTTTYLFNHSKRILKREEFHISNKYVVGHIGRFEHQKNHDFIIDIFDQVYKRVPNSLLILVGDGELRPIVQDKVNKLGLNNNVIFTGIRSDVPDILQAVDVLVFPSFYEGLPGVVLEAQAAGLPCVISDSITSEVKITNLVEYVSLNKNAAYWADRVLRFGKGFKRRNTYDEIVDAGYDIEAVAGWYQEFYLKHNEID